MKNKSPQSSNLFKSSYINYPSIIISIIALSLSIMSFIQGYSNNIYYVDIKRLMDGYERTKIERVALEEKTKILSSNVDSLMADWRNELKSYEQERHSMTKKELALKQELLANKQEQLNTYQQTIQKKIREEEQKASQTVINDINDYVKEYGKEKNYKIVFGASGNGNIMYADESVDLTDEILRHLNKAYEKN